MACVQQLNAASFIVSQANELDAENPHWLIDEKGQAYVTRTRLYP